MTDEGIVTCFNDEQSSKARASIVVTEEGIVICSRFEQLLKELW